MKPIILSMLAGMLVCPTLAADEIDDALTTIAKVAPEGNGHVEAMKAWKVLAAADASKLPTMLAAIKEDQPLANNWIRSAVETVASKASSAGAGIPIDGLKKFLENLDGDPRARRLAYEMLIESDESSKDALLAKLIDDPSVELRRDAVAVVLSNAKEKFETDKAAATKLYRHALAKARDRDQVDEATKQLEELGEEVDLNKHYGFLLHWHLIGPFDNTDKGGFDVEYAPEKQIDLTASYEGKKEEKVAWIDHTSEDDYGVVDLNKAVAKHMGAAGYAYAEFQSASDQEVDLRLTSKNANKLWLNGELLNENEVYHAGSELDQYTCRGKLKKGKNTILLKLCQNEQEESWAQGWQFQFRVCDKVGSAILSTDRK